VLDVQSERSDDIPIVGQVVRTAPAAGVELAEGEPFLMVVSEGPLLRELPESTGLLGSEATTALLALRLEVETVEQYDEVVPAGTVISWSVPGDPTLTSGAKVEPETLPLGSIVAQNIAEGTEVARGSAVAVAISRGPDLVTYPDISAAASYEEAAVILREAGFEPVLEFGDAQGAVQQVRIDGDDRDPDSFTASNCPLVPNRRTSSDSAGEQSSRDEPADYGASRGRVLLATRRVKWSSWKGAWRW
jgi:serine/threonine-protein kinase